MKKSAFYLFLAIIIASFSACEDRIFDSVDETSNLKKGKKQPSDVQFGDLYGDLVEVEMDESGVPVPYPLYYMAEYQDMVRDGIIDVLNPRLSGSFWLSVYVRDGKGMPVLEDGKPKMETILIDPGDDGFLDDPVVLYDLEGEILSNVVDYVFPVEQGRLNLIRTKPDNLSKRMSEVIKNFGDGTVAAVVRDYCGRFYMLRTDAALALGYQDKPIDSPLENMAIYKELMLYGFGNSAKDNGLQFMVEPDMEQSGFNFKMKVDKCWNLGPLDFNQSDTTKWYITMNLAAACIAGASDKTGELILDEIVLVNRFLGIPQAKGSGIDTPAESVTSFFPYVEQEIRMLNKMDKSVYKKYRYFIDYTFFSYSRQKFIETLVDLCTLEPVYDDDGNLIGTRKVVLQKDLTLNDILSGNTILPVEISEKFRYSEKADESNSAAIGFANQADDYVQALEVIHENEEFLVWKMPTPTWSYESNPILRESSPFIYAPDDHEGGSGGGGNQGGGGGNGNGGKK